jgi:cytochrome c-type biogenesis protein CcmH/NrfG
LETNSNQTSDDLLGAAREYFQENKYAMAEPLLNQLILKNAKSPEVFHMLGTIFYDQGKFNKAIRSFRRALELAPAYTDASVGLSIILNDLGRYEEGRKVFQEAHQLLQAQNNADDPYMNEKFALKHDELGEMYMQHNRPKEALEQFYKALTLSSRKPELTMKVVECFVKTGQPQRGIKELKDLVRDFPGFLSARLRLGRLLFEGGDVVHAVDQWEAVLQNDPSHAEALRLIRQSQAMAQVQI